jgi:hypothetical protein
MLGGPRPPELPLGGLPPRRWLNGNSALARDHPLGSGGLFSQTPPNKDPDAPICRPVDPGGSGPPQDKAGGLGGSSHQGIMAQNNI